MALWRKHRFISLQEQDSKDRIAAGSQFIVKRVGSTCVNGLEATESEEILIKFYRDLLELFQCEHGCLLRLIVDLSGAVLYDKDGDMLQRFALSDIRDVIYSTKKEEYARYFILVGREESELSVKAHVLFCENKQKAKLLYDTFIEVFTLGAEMNKYRRQVSDGTVVKDMIKPNPKLRMNDSSNRCEDSTTAALNGVVNTQDAHALLPRRQTWTNSSMTCPRSRPRNEKVEGNELNDSFTELARSRSFGSSTSLKQNSSDMNGNKVPWNDSDVFI